MQPSFHNESNVNEVENLDREAVLEQVHEAVTNFENIKDGEEKEDNVTATTVDVDSRSQVSALAGQNSLADVSSTIS